MKKLLCFILCTYVVLPAITLVVYRYEMLQFYPDFIVNLLLIARVSAGIFLFYLFMTQLILGSRAKWLEKNVGLNIVLKCHIVTTILTVVLLLVHRTIRDGNGGLVEKLGQVVGLSILILVGISVFFWIDTPFGKLPLIKQIKPIIKKYVRYSTFKKIHNIFGLLAIVVGIHVLLTSFVDDQLKITLGIMYVYYAFSLLTYFKHKIIKPIILKKNYFEVVNIIHETEGASENPLPIITIQFKSHNHKAFNYHAGQFAYIRFISGALATFREEHPFSFSSSPQDELISMTIQDEGKLTHRLLTDLKVGDRLTLDGPYGEFHLESVKKRTDTPQQVVAIAGGIGVTPYIGWLEELNNNVHYNYNLVLIWMRREQNDYLSKRILAYNECPNIEVHVLSQSKNKPLQKEFLRDMVNQNDKKVCCYVCGSSSIIRLVKDMLKSIGVKKQAVVTESFSM